MQKCLLRVVRQGALDRPQGSGRGVAASHPYPESLLLPESVTA